MAALLGYAAVMLVVSFVCSVLEAVVLSVPPSYVMQLEAEAERDAARWRDLKLHVDRPLAAILSLATIAHTFGAAMVAGKAQELWGSTALTIASIVLTVLILIVTEFIPKTLGALFWRQLAPSAGALLEFLVRALAPFVWVSRGISRSFGKGRGGNLIRREELTALAELGDRQGLLDSFESRVMTSLLGFRDVRVRDIMTPRTVVYLLRATDRLREAIADDHAMRFSRIPVWRDGPDDIVGYVLKNEMLLHVARGGPDVPVVELAHPFLVVPETLPVSNLLDQLLERHERVALCLNEYGGFEGIATLEDVIETLLDTEIVGKLDPVADMRALARARWRERRERMGLAPDGASAPHAPPGPRSDESKPTGER